MSEWISVKDRLPDDNVPVLIFTPSYPGVSIGSFNGKDFDDLVDRFAHDNKATHWMPLPTPPQGIKNE